MKMQPKICFHIVVCLWFLQTVQAFSTLNVAARKNPTSEKTVSDANLMFEILLGGLDMDQDNNIVLLDMELASMRSGRAFLSQINDHIPRNQSSMAQMATMLDRQKIRPLTQTQFDSLVLSMVYSAQQARRQEREEERQAWGTVLLQLANTTVHELRGSYLFSYA